MKIAKILKKSFISSGQIIVREGNSITVFHVVGFSRVKITNVDDGLMLTWQDGSLGWGKRSIIVDVIE